MIWRSINALLLSLVSASVYGICFAILCVFSESLISSLKASAKALRSVFFYTGVFSDKPVLEKNDKYFRSGISAEISAAARVVVFTLGLITVSYCSLDGEMRFFTILPAAALAVLIYQRTKPAAERILYRLFESVLRIVITVLRIIFYPARRIFMYFYRKMGKNTLK